MKIRKRLIPTLIAMLFCLVLVSGCEQSTSPNTTKPTTPSTDTTNNVKPIVDKKVVLYRVPTDGTQYLLAETKTIKVTENNFALSTVKALVETSPKDTTMENVFPKGTKVLGVKVENGLATVNFSKEFITKTEGEYSTLMMVNAVVNTLTQYPNIKKVQLLSEGKKIIVLGQMDLEEPLSRNETFIKKAK